MSIIYHDIRLHTPYKNSVIIRGTPMDSDPVCLSGRLVFSLEKTIVVSSISLNLVGTHNIDFVENFQTSSGKLLATCPFVSATTVLHCSWTNLLTDAAGVVLPNDTPVAATRQQRVPTSSSQLGNNFTSCTMLRFNHDQVAFDTTPFRSVHPAPPSVVFELPPGNYSLPFQIRLPGNIPESVESLKCSNIVYRLHSSFNPHPALSDLARFRSNSEASKYVRVVRTLSSLQLALNEEFLTENSWAGKLQYKIRIPRKIVPVGSTLKVFILIIPMLKKLKLGKLTFQIAQSVKINSTKPNDFGEKSFADEKIIYHQTLPSVPASQLPSDIWALQVRLPTSNFLRSCSPDVTTVSNLVTIKHKFIIYIDLINPDGHISQVKSKIPLGFYIKPNSKVYARNVSIDPASTMVQFTNGCNLLFDEEDGEIGGESSNSNSIINGSNLSDNSPELLICPCDQLNPDSFLFNDGENDYYNYLTEETSGSNSAPPCAHGNDPNTPALTPSHSSSNLQSFNSLLLASEYPNHTQNNYQIPPTYHDSVNDILFDPKEWSRGTTPIPGTPLSSSYTSLNQLTNINEQAPHYSRICDNDVSDIGEPTPIYDAPSNFLRSALENRLKVPANKTQSLPASRPVSPLRPSSSFGFVFKRARSSTVLNTSENTCTPPVVNTVVPTRPSSTSRSSNLSTAGDASANHSSDTGANPTADANTNTHPEDRSTAPCTTIRLSSSNSSDFELINV